MNNQELRNQVIIRQGRKDDAEAFSHLAMLFLPSFIPIEFKPFVKYLMKRLFSTKRNHFSFEYSYLAEINSRVIGVINGFPGKEKRKEEWRTILLMIRFLALPMLKNMVNLIKIKYLRKVSQLIGLLKIWGKFDDTDYYINGLAVISEYQGMGIGTMLLEYVDNRKTPEQTRLFLDVEIDNSRAIKVYERQGFTKTGKTITFDFDGKKLGFFRMVKE